MTRPRCLKSFPSRFPLGEEPTGGEGTSVGKGTELLVSHVYFHMLGLTVSVRATHLFDGV